MRHNPVSGSVPRTLIWLGSDLRPGHLGISTPFSPVRRSSTSLLGDTAEPADEAFDLGATSAAACRSNAFEG